LPLVGGLGKSWEIAKNNLEFTAIWRAIQNGDPDLAERCCVDHVKAAAVARTQHDRTIIHGEGIRH
jgi:hypothetical protein